MARTIENIAVTRCDFCGAPGIDGIEGPTIKPVLECAHDICLECWRYPGGSRHCPICHPRGNDKGEYLRSGRRKVLPHDHGVKEAWAPARKMEVPDSISRMFRP